MDNQFLVDISRRLRDVEQNISDLPLIRFRLTELFTSLDSLKKRNVKGWRDKIKDAVPLIVIGMLVGSMFFTNNPGGVFRMLMVQLLAK